MGKDGGARDQSEVVQFGHVQCQALLPVLPASSIGGGPLERDTERKVRASRLPFPRNLDSKRRI